MYSSLRAFVAALEARGELLRIKDRVDPVLEIAAIVDQESRAPAPRAGMGGRANDALAHGLGGRALLFENVAGSEIPVLINAFGSYSRMELALGCHEAGHTPGGFDALAARISALTRPVPPRTVGELWDRGKEVLPLLRVPPRTVKRGACQERVITGDAVDLTALPALRCWPLDGDFAAVGYPPGLNDGVPGLGHPAISPADWDARHRGRYITLAGIHTVHAKDRDDPRPASHNIGMYRVQVLGKDRLAMHWHVHHDGAAHWRSWKALGQPMPVAIVLGGESVLPYAATCPLPPGISELLMAGFLNGSKGIPLVRAKTVPLRVPANAEIVIEGYVSHEAGPIGWDPRRPDAGPLGPGAVFEGPFGDHTGFYSMPDRYPVVTVTAITMRERPIYPTTIVGLPPQEDYWLGKATERVMGALLKVVIHDVADYDLPMFGAFHNNASVRIHKAYPLQARRLMHAIWGTGQMAWTKSVFVVTDEVDVHDPAAVLEAVARRCRPSRDLERVLGPVDILDHAAPAVGAAHKLGFDATPRWPGESANGVAAPAPDDDRRLGTPLDARAHLQRLRRLPGVLDAAIPVPGWVFLRADRGHGEPERAGLGAQVRDAALPLDPAADGAGALPYLVVVGREVRLDDAVEPFFHWLANADFGRDLRVLGDRAGFDATPRTPADTTPGWEVRPWPPVVAHTTEQRGLALARRRTWGLAGDESAPDLPTEESPR